MLTPAQKKHAILLLAPLFLIALVAAVWGGARNDWQWPQSVPRGSLTYNIFDANAGKYNLSPIPEVPSFPFWVAIYGLTVVAGYSVTFLASTKTDPAAKRRLLIVLFPATLLFAVGAVWVGERSYQLGYTDQGNAPEPTLAHNIWSAFASEKRYPGKGKPPTAPPIVLILLAATLGGTGYVLFTSFSPKPVKESKAASV